MQLQFFLICYVLINFIFIVIICEPVTENNIDIGNNYVFSGGNQFSSVNLQNRFDVNKPSKLRLYLLEDLAKMRPYINCESGVDLKVTSKNCTCSNYSCQRYYKLIKKPRIFERNCEDVCCGGKQRSKGKSLENDTEKVILTTSSIDPIIKCGEIVPDKYDKLTVPWIAHISSGSQDRCTGSILSSRAVITSSNCVDRSNEITVIRTDPLTLKMDKLKVKEIIRDDLVKNSVILVLSEPLLSIEPKFNPCLPQNDIKNNYQNCYLGLSNRTAKSVKLFTSNECKKFAENPDIPRDSLCVQYEIATSDNVGPGAPLICSWDSKYPNNYQIVGVLSERYNDVLIFDNINRIHNMIKLNLNNLM